MRWLCLLLPVCLSACERGGWSTVPPNHATVADGDTEVVASGESVPIVAVRQRLLSIDPSHWRFDPSGRLIAEPFTDADNGVVGCGVWDIESGTFVREYVDAEAEHAHNPCLEWDAEAGGRSDTSADGKLRAEVHGGLDGAALFYGYDWPTHAIDPKTGALLYEVSHPILDVLDLDEIDPSWRWIHRPDGSVTRTLDFRRIEIGPTWAQIESGMFEGEVQDLPANLRFRATDDPDAPASYTAGDLEPWLRAPGLIRAFFEGKPLPTPRAPVAALATLNKRNKQG